METKDHGNGIIEFISDGIIVNDIKDWTELFLDFFVQKTAIIKEENLNSSFYDRRIQPASATPPYSAKTSAGVL